MILPFGEDKEQAIPYPWTDKERKFVAGVWTEFQKMYALRAEPLDILGGITLQDYLDESVRDYGVLANEFRDPNDPVEQYQSTISRDKADVFIANLIGQLMYSDVIAQNNDQEIDRVVSRTSSALLEWAYKTDGWPSESGQQKNARYIHKMVVEGTVHVIDVVTKDGLESELVPNEEVYIKNFWQPNVQKQPMVIRAKTNVLYEEVEAMFGDMDRWEYAIKGAWAGPWFNEAPFLKDGFQGLEWEDKMQVLYVWKVATPSELRALKKAGKVAKSAPRACFYNVIINDIPMFPPDNLSPFKHGYYPLAKGKFQEFAKPEFYYGNSAPNKVKEDKRWLDQWKTLLRYKGKLGVLKPSLVYGGSLEEEILLPSKMTPAEEGIRIEPIAGVSDGVSQQDVTLLQMAESEIDRGSVSPQSSGQSGQRKETARAATIMAANAEKLLDSVSQQVAFFQASRSFPILLSLFQFMSKREIKKVAIPDQTLQDGLRGTLEVIFEDPGDLTEMEMLKKSFELRAQEVKSRVNKSPKEIVYVNPGYIKDLKYYVTSDASSLLQDKSAMKNQEFTADFAAVMLPNPDLFDRKEASREWVRRKDYSERILAKEQPEGGAHSIPQIGGQQPPSPEMRATPEDTQMNAMATAATGQGMPSLPPEM